MLRYKRNWHFQDKDQREEELRSWRIKRDWNAVVPATKPAAAEGQVSDADLDNHSDGVPAREQGRHG
jgi:hypothetical protein